MTDYVLLDSGNGQKLERFGEVILIRPCSQAIWRPRLDSSIWSRAHALFSREGGNQWKIKKPMPSSWVISVEGIRFKLKATPFGHLGIFPEQRLQWRWIQKQIAAASFLPRVLNLFAYSGGATLAAALPGAQVCHLDASKAVVNWARENAMLNNLEKAPIQWIVEDARKYTVRAFKRKESYDAIIIDPPTFGRGRSKEVFKIEKDFLKLLEGCISLLSKRPLFVLLSCHTSSYSPLVLEQILREVTPNSSCGRIKSGEMVLKGPIDLPNGVFARWTSAA